MAKKRKTKTTKTGVAALLGTQREALQGISSKRSLAALAVKLAAQHGTDEEKGLKRSEIESRKRDAIRALVAELAVRARQRKQVHLSELEGWPVCWSEERREAVKPADLLTTPIAVDSAAVTCARCKKAAELPSPAETAALRRAEVEAERPKRKRSAGKGNGTRTARAKRQLKLKKNLPVRLKLKGLEVKGVVRPDGSMRAKGKNFESPHAAAKELAGELVNYRIDGYQAWRFEDADGRWRMLRDHS